MIFGRSSLAWAKNGSGRGGEAKERDLNRGRTGFGNDVAASNVIVASALAFKDASGVASLVVVVALVVAVVKLVAVDTAAVVSVGLMGSFDPLPIQEGSVTLPNVEGDMSGVMRAVVGGESIVIFNALFFLRSLNDNVLLG